MRREDEVVNDSVYYDSWKEERDIILEYNQVNLDDANIVNILGIGIDNVTRSQAVVKVMKMIDTGGIHHVILLNPYKLHRYKSNTDLQLISSRASMHIASGAGLGWAASLLRTPLKERIPPISFLMDLVRIAEIKEYSIFLVGARPEIVEKTFSNIQKSFPKIRIVGRHGGYFNSEREKSVVEAIRKSNANIIFVGLGFPKEDRWIDKYRNEFRNAVLVGVGGAIDIISGEIKKAPAFFMDRGLDWFYRIITKPWRIGRIVRTKFFFFRVIL
ncbi:MAG: glycosyltransferase, partial [Spirochaetales bacterium]